MKRSKEEIQAWRNKLKTIAAKVKAMSPAEREVLVMQYGTITATGHQLSGFNMIFLAMQAGRPLAQVGGFKQWLKAGRQVIKGEHAIGQLYVPCTPSKEAQAEGNEKTYFKTVPVFDVSQTEPLDPEYQAKQTLKLRKTVLI